MSIIYLDTETTGVDPFYDQIWELYAHKIDDTGEETILDIQIHHDHHLLQGLPPKFRADHDQRFDPTKAVGRIEAAHIIHTFIGNDKPHIVGLNPAFDTNMIAHHYHLFGYMPNWNYHLIDLEAMTLGHLAAQGIPVGLPFKSDALAALIGVNPDDYDRHTAKGDVQFAVAWHQALLGSPQTENEPAPTGSENSPN